MAQNDLAMEYRQRGRGTLGNNEANVSETPRQWSRCANNGDAVQNLQKNRGTGALWMSMDANRHYNDPLPNPRASTQEGAELIARGRGTLDVQLLMSGAGYRSTRAPRVRPEAQEVADHHQGKGTMNCLNQNINRGYHSSRPQSRVKGEGEENSMKGRGTMGIVLDSEKNRNFNVPRGEPRVKPEASDNAFKGQGQMTKVLNDSLNSSYNTARGQPRVKDEAAYNATQGKGTMDIVLGAKQAPFPQNGGVPRVKPEAQDINEKNRGTLTNIYYKFGNLPTDPQPNPKVSGDGNEICHHGRNGTAQYFLSKYGQLPRSARCPPRVKSEARGIAQMNKGTMTEHFNPKKNYKSR